MSNYLEQRDEWGRRWQQSNYSLQDKTEGNKWVSVRHSTALPFIIKNTSRDARILEAGCGMGQWVVYLDKLGYEITGLDYSEPTIRKLNITFPNQKFVVGDVTDLQYDNESFNVLLSWGVVEHFEEGPEQALVEAHRVLSKNGKLYITVPIKSILRRLLAPLIFIHEKAISSKFIRIIRKKKTLKKSFHQHRFTPNEFRSQIEKAGFKIQITIPISHEVGLARPINKVLRFGKRKPRLFHNNKEGVWDGLSPIGNYICKFLKGLSPWITPDQVFIIAQKS